MINPKIIDGKIISGKVRDSLKPRIDQLVAQGIVPGLAVVLIGDDPASKVYVGMKARAFEGMNLYSETFRLAAETDEKTVLNLINNLNNDPKFHGILVQLPLPSHLDEMKVILAIDPAKDADGLHPVSLGKMVLGVDGPLPCTPNGIRMLLKYSDIDPSGKHVVVIGRSNIVGKPVANLLMQKRELGDATVTVCHSKTKDLPAIAKQADILIAAIGRPGFVDRKYVKKGAVVIDVGVNRIDDPAAKRGYRLVGDVNFDDVKNIVSAITPVPGGVGPMTISMLIANTVYLAEKLATKEYREAIISTVNFINLIKSRRSIRQFKQDPVPEIELIDCVDAARLAPSAANLQPLEYVLVTDRKQVEAIFPLLKWAAYIQPAGNPLENNRPVAYLIVLINDQIGKKWSNHDAGAAIENFMLAALSKGIGSCWLASVDRESIRKIYRIPEQYSIDSVIALGFPAEKPVIETVGDSIRYWKDEKSLLHVPKRSIKTILHINAFKTN